MANATKKAAKGERRCDRAGRGALDGASLARLLRPDPINRVRSPTRRWRTGRVARGVRRPQRMSSTCARVSWSRGTSGCGSSGSRGRASSCGLWARPGTDAARGYVDHPKTGERFDVRFVDWPRSKQRQANLVATAAPSRALHGRGWTRSCPRSRASRRSCSRRCTWGHAGLRAWGRARASRGRRRGREAPEVPRTRCRRSQRGSPTASGAGVRDGVVRDVRMLRRGGDLTEDEAAALVREHGIDPATLGPDGKPMAVASLTAQCKCGHPVSGIQRTATV